MKSLAKAQVAFPQGHLRIHTKVPAQMNYGEEQIAQLRFNRGLPRRIAGSGLGLELRGFFGQLGQKVAPVRPIEPGLLSLGAQLRGLGESPPPLPAAGKRNRTTLPGASSPPGSG